MKPAASPTVWLALLTVFVAGAYALYTDHRWEDYYITYRSSLNLAEGRGLVYQAGERLHTFTSPLGVLLPAAARFLTGNDEAALGMFRLLSICALAGAVGLVAVATRSWGWPLPATLLAAGLAVTDAKTLDFATNGMETGLLLLFLAWALHTFATGGQHGALRLGLAWAGLMWTRPDAFIPIAALAAAFMLFPGGQRLAGDRPALLATYWRAGLWCAGIYLPWLIWTWQYYGSPVPNTITAKSLSTQAVGVGQLLRDAVALPFTGFRTGPLERIFCPPYWFSGDWPVFVIRGGRLLAWLALLPCLLPRLRPETRALSLAFWLMSIYLTHILHFPWYQPPAAWLAILTLAGVAAQALAAEGRGQTVVRRGAMAAICGTAVFSLVVLVATGRQAHWQQALVEAQRREIGLWLRENAAPSDSILLEPAGYVGFYSGRKIHDLAGLVSREVVAARRELGADWVRIIQRIDPTWVVFRPTEPFTEEPALLAWFDRHYRPVRTFDNLAAVRAVPSLWGRGFLEFDARFTVYRKSSI